MHQRREARPAPEELTPPPSMRPRREPPRPPTRPERREPPRPERPVRTERRVQAQPVEQERRRPEPARPERRSSSEPRGAAVWFTINVGRSKNADPKWIVPLLCRRGGINKSAIGKIQILARETRVEIAADASERFAVAVRKPDAKDRNIQIEPIDAPAP